MANRTNKALITCNRAEAAKRVAECPAYSALRQYAGGSHEPTPIDKQHLEGCVICRSSILAIIRRDAVIHPGLEAMWWKEQSSNCSSWCRFTQVLQSAEYDFRINTPWPSRISRRVGYPQWRSRKSAFFRPLRLNRRQSQSLKLLFAAVVFTCALICTYAWWTVEDSRLEYGSARTYMCLESGQTFTHLPRIGESDPIYSRFSDKPTAYQTEKCYWAKNASGEWMAKAFPTYVVLKSRINSSSSEPTFCPECGREVIPHNPSPP